MLEIPNTSPQVYVSSIVALNIINKEGTGDWHSAASLSKGAFPSSFYIYGTGQEYNTNLLLGYKGVVDGTNRLHSMGYRPANTPVWIAEHPRACVDYLYYDVLKTGILGIVMLDDWFPAVEDKEAVYELLEIIEPKITINEKENLILWKKKNPIV